MADRTSHGGSGDDASAGTSPGARAPGSRAADTGSAGARSPGAGSEEPREVARLRRRIDALDRRIVALLNERAELGREVGRAKAATGRRRGVLDTDREREVLLRVTMANEGPIPQADLLAIYRRLIAVTRSLERRDRR